MRTALYDMLCKLHEQGKHVELAEIILAEDGWQEDYDLSCWLARAYNNLERFEDVLMVLQQTEVPGAEDGYWHFRKGYALYYLNRFEESVAAFEQSVKLIPSEEDAWQFLQLCYERLGLQEQAEQAAAKRLELEHSEQTEEEAFEAYDETQATEYLLKKGLHGMFAVKDSIDGDCLILEDWGMTIQPKIVQLKEQSALLYATIMKNDWDRGIFECSAGMGGSKKSAVGMASGVFLFSMMSGINRMMEEIETECFETQFAGERHIWKCYTGDTTGLGDIPKKEEGFGLWELLKEHIKKRLGNQKLCYIKVYGAKNGDDITGECRINDAPSKELSELVAKEVSLWDTDGFGSIKQFFFIQQEEDTYREYPYTEDDLHKKTVQATEIYTKCQAIGEDYYDQLVEDLGDQNLADEFYVFLPEICAENAFEKISYPETVRLRIGEEVITVYKNQLASYYCMRVSLFDGFQSGEIDDNLYSSFIADSTTYNVISKAKNQGTDLIEDGGMLSLSYGMSENYKIR